MGMYCYITESERKTLRVCEDKEVNDLFQEALLADPSLMIEQRYMYIKRGWLKGHERVVYFNVLHEHPAHDGSAFQARYQVSASGKKSVVMAYLYGIINGYEAFRNYELRKNKS